MKKIISLVLCTVMILSLFTIIPFSASAKETDVASVSASSGTTGDCTWTLDNDGVLTISGEGNMGEGHPNNSDVSQVIIEDSVKSISEHAFSGCSDLKSAVIGTSVESIGAYAFQGCTSLTSITIPDSVKSIDYSSFGDTDSNVLNLTIYGFECSAAESCASYFGVDFVKIDSNTTGDCIWTLDDAGVLLIFGEGKMEDYSGDTGPWGTGISQVIIKSGVTDIENNPFSKCTELTGIKVDPGNTVYDSRNGCNAIIKTESDELICGCNKTVIPDSVKSIGDYAFSGCTCLTSITIPDSVKSIGDYAFYGCHVLKSVTIPNSVTSISSGAFSGCTDIKSIKVDSGNTVYDSRNDCNAIIKTESDELIVGCMNTVIPDSVKSIGDRAFENCSELKSLTIGNSVTSIGYEAFYQCKRLTSVIIPDSVKSIGDRAFENCTSLTSVTIPDSVKSIGDQAFYNCSELKSLTIGNSVTSIGEWVFYQCKSLTSVTIPDSVKSIDEHAFLGCTGLKSVTIPDSVESIGRYAFYVCTSLTSITIPSSVTSIGAGALGYSYNQDISENEKTKNFVISGYKGSAAETYAEDNGFTFFELKPENTGDCTWAFDYNGVLYISGEGEMANYDYWVSNTAPWGTEISKVIIQKGVENIGSFAFYQCTGLTSVTIPDSVTSIGDLSFSDCTGLTSITIPDSVTGIGSGAFAGCTGFRNITIPDSVESIGNHAFSGCTGLTGVTVSDSVKSINYNAFLGCTGLESITIPDSVESIGEYAFGYSSYNLDTLNYEKIENFTIYGYKGSAAETYAIDNEITFIELISLGERLEGYSISLEGDIAVNFYMSIPDEIASNKDGKMHFEIPNGDTAEGIDISVSEAGKKTVNNKTYYIFKCPVSAKEMTSQIKGYLTLGDSKGKEYTYTVKEYAEYILSNTDVQQYAEAAPLVKAMLNYGAYSQLWFDKNTGSPANSALEESEKALAEVTINAEEPKTAGLPDGVSFEGSTLSLKSNTTLSLYFTGGEELSFSCGDLTVDTETSGDYTIARVRGINAAELSDEHVVTVKSGDTSGTVSYVPTYYLKYILENNECSEGLKNVAKALYTFHVEAKEYFTNQA